MFDSIFKKKKAEGIIDRLLKSNQICVIVSSA